MNKVTSLRNTSEKGITFVRAAIGLSLSTSETGNDSTRAAVRYGEGSLAHRLAEMGGFEQLGFVRATVAAGATVSPSWASTLIDAEQAATDFFSLVRERSLIGRLPLRRMPLRTRLISAASGFSAAWIGEGTAVPLSAASFNEDSLPARKVSSLIVLTKELAESMDPAAELLIREDMVNALVAVLDASFLDPANAGQTDIEPASVTNGITPIVSSGDGLADIRALIDDFPGDLEKAVLVGSPETFAALHNPLELPGLGVRGGVALGIPAIASKAAGDTLSLIDPSGIALGTGATEIRTSSHGSVEMDDAPSGSSVDGPSATTLVSLWQTNSIGLMTEQTVNWSVARPSVSVISGVAQS